MNKSRGRPPGRPATRARITEAARSLFPARGYAGTTLRAIAASADVDPALIAYHFGSKQGLFAEALRVPCADPAGLTRALQGDRAHLADRLLVAVTDQWDAADPAELRLAGRDEATLAVVRDYLDGELRHRIADRLGGPEATRRATAAVGVIGGVVFTRYLSPVGSIAALPADAVRVLFRPALDAALRDPTPDRLRRRRIPGAVVT